MGHEEQLAEKVISYLQGLKWEVYQEVKPKFSSSVADIVAVQGGRVWIIETKMSFSLAVIAQAYKWLRYAHWVSIAVPEARRCSSGLSFSSDILKHYGIGLMRVYDRISTYSDVHEDINPKLNRKAWSGEITKSLCAEHKTFAKAGNNRCEYYSPFKRTCDEVVRTVRKNPGINMKSLIENITHHYASASSAKASLSYWVKAGKIKGIKMEHDGRSIKFYPEGTHA